ncbi:hypothetical protein F4824DRAFT_514378 [Ustulina deusta]|nr:hypothetical protein F4824DRAFT_514378 [Ustulina deusta]
MSSKITSEGDQQGHDSGKIQPAVGQVEANQTGGEASSSEQLKGNEPETLTDINPWFELAQYINAFIPAALDKIGPDASIKIDLTCEICHDDHLRRSLPHGISGMLSNTDDDYEAVHILPCGHFFGAKCMAEWIAKSAVDGFHPVCPKCRFLLIHPECEHPFELTEFPLLDCRDPESVASYIPWVRVLRLRAKGDMTCVAERTFVDVSGCPPEWASRELNYGVMRLCIHCAREKVQREWEALFGIMARL